MRFFRYQVFIVILFSASFKASGQEMKIVPPTPNAMKMTEYYASKPNLYTGTASVSVPLYTIDFDGWQLPIALSYNASGIRTNEEASEVGLGWALNSTGVISRTIRGSDDLFPGNPGAKKGYVYSDSVVSFKLHYDPLYDSTPEFVNHPGFESYYWHLASDGPDTEPDAFNFNFFGYSGTFALTQKVVTGTIKAIKITEGPCRITFDEGSETFTVTTPDGFVGEFTVKERSTTFSGSMVTNNRINCCGENLIDILEFENSSGQYRTVTSWYLSKITSPKGKVMNFTYDLNPDGSSPYISNTRTFGELADVTSNDICMQTVHEHVYLKNISSPDVTLNYSMEDREDQRKNYLFSPDSSAYQNKFPSSQNLKRYKTLTITGVHPSSTLSKVITFDQSYFNQQYHAQYANNENELRWLRSRLDKITIDDQAYRFYYENGVNGLPNKMTNAIDHFGFYNGQNQVTRLLPPEPNNLTFGNCNLQDTAQVIYYRQRTDRQVNFSYGKAGLIKKVEYPTKGYSVFEYEPHMYLPETTGNFLEANSSGLAGGARIKSLKDYGYDGTLQLSKSYLYVNDPNQPASSGRLMTPLYNRFIQVLYDSNPPHELRDDCLFKYKTNSSIPGNNAAEGKVIGYSKVYEVFESTQEDYKNLYYFENRPNKVEKWNALASGFPNLNGQTIEIRNYNAEGKLVSQTLFQDYEHNIDTIKAIAYQQQGDNTWLSWYTKYKIITSFNTPFTTITNSATTPSNIIEFPNGTLGGSFITTHQEVEYNNQYLLKSNRTYGSNGEILLTEYKRPGDYATPSVVLDSMISKNIIDPVIEEVSNKNGVVVSAIGNEYEIQNYSNDYRINQKATYSFNKDNGNFIGSLDGSNFPTPYEMRQEFTLYDVDNGNLLEYNGPDKVTNSFIWGYNGSLPIAHGKGVTHDQLNGAYLATVNNPDYEISLRNHPNIAGKPVTTYAHNPQVGVTEVTDPSGTSATYEYDQYGRLKKVIDNDGNTIEQYEYHFKELPVTKILTVSGSLDFGTLTPDMFTQPLIPYTRCTDVSRILTLSNTGESDLTVSSIFFPTAFSTSWSGGVITAGTSVDVIITFDDAMSLGNYDVPLTINSDRTNTNEPLSVNATANYVNRICDIIPSETIVDFGEQSGNSFFRPFQITNNGNAPIEINGAPLDWIPGGSGPFTHPDFEIATPTFPGVLNPVCLNPGQSLNFAANFLYHGSSYTSTKMSLDVNNCPIASMKDIVLIQANPTRIIEFSQSPLMLPAFSGISTSDEVLVTNSGTGTLQIEGVTISDPKFSMTSSAELPLTIPPGGSVSATITFTPDAFDFTTHNATLTFASNKTSGNNVLDVTANRTVVRAIQLTPGQLDFYGTTFIPQFVTISNSSSSNDNLTISGITNSYDQEWHASISGLPVTLSPGQNTSMSVFPKVPNPQQPVTIYVNSNKTAGDNAVILTDATKIVRISETSYTFPSFTSASSNQSVTVYNDGNTTLSVSSITSSNGKFTASPQSFSIPQNGSQAVTITYNSTDFSVQNNTYTFNGNQTSGINTLGVTAERTPVRTIGITPTSIAFGNFTSSSVSQDVTVTNTGNDVLTVTSITSNNASIGASPNSFSIPAGGQQTVTITLAPPAFNFSAQSGTLTVNGNQTAGSNTISVSGMRTPVRNIELSSTALVFNYTGQQQTVTITNSSSSNDYLNVSGITPSSTPYWSASFTPANLAPGQSASLDIVRLPGETPDVFYVTVNSNNSNNNGDDPVITSTANTRTITLSPTSISFPAFSSPSISQSITVGNSGNTTLTISGISSTNAMFSASPSSFTVTPGGQQTVEITFTPSAYNFSAQNGTLTFNGDQTGGNGSLSVSGQRTSLRTIQVSPTQLSFNLSFVWQYVTVSNVGNDYLNITGINNPNTVDWDASISNLPVTLSPGQSTSMGIMRKVANPQQPLNISVLSNKNGGSETVQVTALTRIIGVSPSSFTFSSFTGTSATQNVTVNNTGNSALTISSVSSTNSRFTASPTSFSIGAGGSQTVAITYTPTDFTLQSGTLTFNGDQTSGNGSLSVSGQRTSLRTIQVSPTQLSFNLSFTWQYVTVSNVGNDYLTITGINNPNTVDWDASISNLPVTLSPGQNTSMGIMKKVANPQQPLNISVLSNKNGGSETVQVTAPTRIIGVSPSSFTFSSFTGTSNTQNVTVNNTGNSTLTISSVSSTNSRFTASPTSFSIGAGSSQTVAITYTPTDFALQSSTLTFNGDQTSGNGSLSVSGQRTSLRTIQLSPTQLSFNLSFTWQYVTVSNVGNDNLNITGINNPNTVDWDASISNLPVTLSPGQNTSMGIMKKVANPQQPLNISVLSNKNGGSETVQVTAPTRIIGVSPSSFTFSSFTGTSNTQNVTVNNTGNSTLTISSVSSTNSRFTASPTSFSIGAGSSQTVAITYTPTDFTLQSSTLTFNGDQSSGSSTLSVSGQRTQNYQLSLSTTSVSIKPSMQVGSIYVTNTGNVDATVNSVGNSNPSKFNLQYLRYNGVSYISTTLPYTLTPGSSLLIEVRTAVSGDYSNANGTATIFNNQGGTYLVNLSRSTF